MGRWRSLHENTTIAIFISENDEALARRYLDHQFIENFKAANQYNEHCEMLHFDKIDEGVINRLNIRKEELIMEYGEDFKGEYGWAASLLKNKKPNFRNIEQSINLHYLRPYYKFASHTVHANAKSIGYRLGLSLTKDDILLAGPSNEGFIDPIQCTSLSFIQSTIALINLSPSYARQIFTALLWMWHEGLKNDLVEAEKKLIESGGKKTLE